MTDEDGYDIEFCNPAGDVFVWTMILNEAYSMIACAMNNVESYFSLLTD